MPLLVVWSILALLLPAVLQAQGVRVLAPVVEGEAAQPLPDAWVQFRSLDGQSIQGLLSDAQGQARCTLALPVVVQVSHLGYHRRTDTLRRPDWLTVELIPNERQLEPQVVTAQYAPLKAQQSIYRLRVYDQARIENQAAINLGDLLRQELNIRIANDNILGSSLSLQGLSGQNIKILINGVPVIGRMNGNIDLGQLNLNNIERVEVIEGPLSVQYGTDAAGGVINLITKQAPTQKPTGEFNFYTESVNRVNVDGRVAARLGKNAFALTAGRYFFGGWSPDPEARRIPWKPRTQLFGTLDYHRQVGRWNLGYQLSGFQEDLLNRGEVLARRFRPYAFDELHTSRRLSNVLTASHVIENRRYLDLTFSHQYFDRIKTTYRKDLVTLDEQVTANPAQQDTSRFDHWMARGTYSMNRAGTKVNYQVGYDLNHQTGWGQRIDGRRQQMGDYALFTTVEYRPTGRWTLRPGLRAAWNTRYGAPLIPSLHVRYALNEHWSIRASWAEGFRAPDLKELYLFFVDVNHNIVGNPDLQAERATNFQSQIAWRRAKGRYLWTWEGLAYHNYLSNRIQMALVDIETLRYTYINVGEARTGGGQTSLGLRTERLSATVGVAYAGLWNPVGLRPAGGQAWFFSPEASLQLGWRIPKVEVEINAFLKHNGRLQFYSFVSETEVGLSYIDPYSLLDVNLSRRWWKNRLRTTLGVRNLFDVQNVAAFQSGGAHTSAASSLNVGMGRFAFASLGLAF